VLRTGAKPPKKGTHTTLQKIKEPANRSVQNTDPQEHVAAALVSGMTPTACLHLPVATAMPGRTQEDVSTYTVRLMPTTCLQLPVTITAQPLSTSTVTPTEIMMLHDNPPEDPVSDKDEKQGEEDSELVLDANGNNIFAYEMAMNKRVKSNMEHLKRLDVLKFVPRKAPSTKKTIKKGKKGTKQAAAQRKTRRMGKSNNNNEEEEDIFLDSSNMDYYGENDVVLTLAAYNKNMQEGFFYDSSGTVQWVIDSFVKTRYREG
jgi:hypothetical protein